MDVLFDTLQNRSYVAREPAVAAAVTLQPNAAPLVERGRSPQATSDEPPAKRRFSPVRAPSPSRRESYMDEEDRDYRRKRRHADGSEDEGDEGESDRRRHRGGNVAYGRTETATNGDTSLPVRGPPAGRIMTLDDQVRTDRRAAVRGRQMPGQAPPARFMMGPRPGLSYNVFGAASGFGGPSFAGPGWRGPPAEVGNRPGHQGNIMLLPDGQVMRKGICFAFVRSGHCPRGEGCPYAHDPNAPLPVRSVAKVPFQSRQPSSAVVVKPIPFLLNNIAQLNQHFTQFGRITNIMVGKDDGGRSDPKAAVIEFATPAEARAAVACSEAILGNRFIKCFYAASAGVPVASLSTQPAQTEGAPAETETVATEEGLPPVPRAEPVLMKTVPPPAVQARLARDEALKSLQGLKEKHVSLMKLYLEQQKTIMQTLEAGTLSSVARAELMEKASKLQQLIATVSSDAQKAQTSIDALQAKQQQQQQLKKNPTVVTSAQHDAAALSKLQATLEERRREVAKLGSIPYERGRGRGSARARGRGRGRGAG